MNAPTLLDKWRVMERAFADPELTDRDRKVLFFVLGRLDNSMGYADLSLPWIGQQAGIGDSKGNVVRVLGRLRDRGYLTWRKGGGRAARNRYSIASIDPDSATVRRPGKGVTSETLSGGKGVAHDTRKGVASETEKGVTHDTPNIVLDSRLKNPSKQNQQASSLNAARESSAGRRDSKPYLSLVKPKLPDRARQQREADEAMERATQQLMREHQLDRASAMVMLLEMPEAEANVLLGPAWCRAVGL